MMFVAMLAASDPVAMLAGMKELGADPRQITIISAVSNMKTGCRTGEIIAFQSELGERSPACSQVEASSLSAPNGSVACKSFNVNDARGVRDTSSGAS